jgi:hypothetical protein
MLFSPPPSTRVRTASLFAPKALAQATSTTPRGRSQDSYRHGKICFTTRPGSDHPGAASLHAPMTSPSSPVRLAHFLMGTSGKSSSLVGAGGSRKNCNRTAHDTKHHTPARSGQVRRGHGLPWLLSTGSAMISPRRPIDHPINSWDRARARARACHRLCLLPDNQGHGPARPLG